MSQSPMIAGQTIVVVEDDVSLLGAITFALETDGFHARGYADGRELLGTAAAAAADCLVIDYKLPGLDGLTLLAALRRGGVRAPAILITTDPDARCRAAAAEAGVVIVEKPLIDGRLVRRIEEVLAGEAPN